MYVGGGWGWGRALLPALSVAEGPGGSLPDTLVALHGTLSFQGSAGRSGPRGRTAMRVIRWPRCQVPSNGQGTGLLPAACCPPRGSCRCQFPREELLRGDWRVNLTALFVHEWGRRDEGVRGVFT